MYQHEMKKENLKVLLFIPPLHFSREEKRWKFISPSKILIGCLIYARHCSVYMPFHNEIKFPAF